MATFGLLGLRLGLRPLGDNSLFVHLRTGLDIVARGAIPREDVYSFTARGEPWVVQSWLAEASYGLAHRLGGFAWVRLEHGLLYGVLALLIARLARTGSPLRTATTAGLAIGLGVVYWSPRPLAFGLLALSLVVTITEANVSHPSDKPPPGGAPAKAATSARLRFRGRGLGRGRGLPPWLLVPVAWVWVNAHGSFVLGLGWLVLVAIGQWLDARSTGFRPRTRAGTRESGRKRVARPPVLACLAWFTAGLVVAAVNPLGPRLLTFPLAVYEKRDVFAQVAEWRSPAFASSTHGLFTLACLAGIVLVLVTRRGHRRGWADDLPAVAFLAAALAAQRNLPMAAVVVAPVLGRSLATTFGRDEFRMRNSSRPNVAIAGALAALAVVFVATTANQQPFDLEGYPTEAATYIPRNARVVTTDVAAGYLILQRGRQANVFIDDRVDMYPTNITKDYLRLLDGKAADVLERYDEAEYVLWPTNRPFDDDRWQKLTERDGWIVYQRR